MSLKSSLQPAADTLKRAWAKTPLISPLRLERRSHMLYVPRLRKEAFPKINLIIIGAQKSGTTTLYKYLAAQPHIHMSYPFKEPGYFNDWTFIRRYFERDRGYRIGSREELYRRYMLKGYAGQPLFGEASTYYTIGDQSRGQHIPQRMMKECGPEVKLIYIMRDPFERMRSNYLHLIRKNYTSGAYQNVIQEEEILVKTGRYHYQLEPYAATFGQKNLLLLEFDELRHHPSRIIRRLKDFLQLELSDDTGLLSASNVAGNRPQYSAESLELPEEAQRRMYAIFSEDARLLKRDYGVEPAWTQRYQMQE